MSTEHAILGLLNQRPMHGYEIKKEFEKSVSYIWSINIGQLYTLLKKMEKENKIVKKVVPQENKPDKLVYKIADKGRITLQKWLSEPVVMRQTKDEFYLKMMFLTQTKKEDAKKYIDKQVDIIEKQLNEFNKIKSTNKDSKNNFMGVLLEASIMHFQVDIQWLNLYKERMGL
ncbi:DNA-binding PadR family transcriptional regulator [Clostridium algifaecis]|uniref:DNA-binding PadR family transcriptional regulator n=1 Tax=Clostridium algifaecis TaxID=1472040 RepID=A0ABS4KPZ0_9CLOT|nr:PadR family transcriptional regulator [Clostridium algifaecis]MBP2032107.1 DNA-binding PadR family transcriptional regulator [Clostridium algifaecis]